MSTENKTYLPGVVVPKKNVGTTKKLNHHQIGAQHRLSSDKILEFF